MLTKWQDSIWAILLLPLACFCYDSRDRTPWSKNKTHPVNSQKEIQELFDTSYLGNEVDAIILDDGTPLQVVDVMLLPLNISLQKFQMMRFAFSMGAYHSYVGLLKPKQLTEADITSRWRIDRTALLQFTYYYKMIELLFLSNRFNLSRDCDGKILTIGLGGGTINSFLHQIFPQMNITAVEIDGQMIKMARKWFGLLEDDHQRVIQADGVTFLADSVKKGDSYDAILLDAGGPQLESDFICPHKSFLKKDVLRNIATLLPKHGIFISNALHSSFNNVSSDEDMSKYDKRFQYLIEKFSTVFKYCYRKKADVLNQVVYCLHQTPVPKLRTNIQHFLAENANIISGTHIILNQQ
ncbi:unnamed protein product [Cylicocyclus nassatus]|uniref:PABS domain-containing protein n=1 Tax=Cylicocyclus nassatus TaxID=53992 RepID=A0AA36GNC9_CYLNA|nr:unnamed protein product [Cylicocyclus nassatus]